MSDNIEKYDISDDDIRIIKPEYFDYDVNPETVKPRLEEEHREREQIVRNRRRPIWPFVLLAFLLIGLLLWFMLYHPLRSQQDSSFAPDSTEEYIHIQEDSIVANAEPQVSSTPKYTTVRMDTINDVVLRSLIPSSNSKAAVHVGNLPEKMDDIILAAQAADIRKDNKCIVGDFIHAGEIVSKGHSKRGFCAIIENSFFMGCETSTPLFEKAYNEGGDFFRQFSLVHKGKFGETTPKGKFIRRALCYRNSTISIVETLDPESYHDFSQALIDMGVEEAVSLVGGIQISFVRQESGECIDNLKQCPEDVQVTYILWR